MASSKCVVESDIYSFMTAPTSGVATAYPMNISIVADLGLDNDFN